MTSDRLDEQVRMLAGDACEYCRLPQSASRLRFVLESRHRASTRRPENVALCCGRCNRHKGPNLSGIDPESQMMSRLFHPRQDVWSEHFRWEGVTLVGLTPIGRATVAVLAINHSSQLLVREALRCEAD